MLASPRVGRKLNANVYSVIDDPGRGGLFGQPNDVHAVFVYTRISLMYLAYPCLSDEVKKKIL